MKDIGKLSTGLEEECARCKRVVPLDDVMWELGNHMICAPCASLWEAKMSKFMDAAVNEFFGELRESRRPS